MNLQPLLDFATDAIWQSGRMTLGYFQTGIEVERKSDDSPVTIADKNAEAYLRRRIEQQFPDHGIIGEEYGEKLGSSGLSWVIDPIDGTKSFIHHVPLFGTLVALERDGEPVVGVVACHAVGETVSGATGMGAFLNGEPCRVSETVEISDATVTMTSVSRMLRGRAEGRLASTGRRLDAVDRLIGIQVAHQLPVLQHVTIDAMDDEQGGQRPPGPQHGEARARAFRCGLPQNLGQASQCRRLEQGGERELAAEGPLDLGEQLARAQRVPAEVEEIAPQAHDLHTQHLAPDAGERPLDRGLRCLEGR